MPRNVIPITPLLYDSSIPEIQLQRFYGEQCKAGFSAPGYLILVPPVFFYQEYSK